MSLVAFASVWLIHLVAAMSPGPSFVVCVRTAVSEGFGTAVALAIGFGLGAALWAATAMAGLALLFELVPALFAALKFGGAAFLLFIAFMMWRHARDPLPSTEGAAPRSAASAIRLGFLTFASNPKTAVFFGAVFVGLVPAETPPLVRIALIGVIFLNETLWYLAVARVFSLPRARTAYARLKAWIDRAFGSLIALFGLKIALS
ncbi:LysE family transporter [Thalassococcus sp. CAU 1522]|uniref:LysE family transporter n=1 Tax=Thalassococcus arenae TaxID=2851652 RepID=A0ABS6NAE9_9RHOB|nr:LysE family transporter [Thalassococcus arenae]MBV2360980.1 LysE family transporter [Thalassococcus arenae]